MDFYNLCNGCFNQFDNQKMRGCFKQLMTDSCYNEKVDFYTESSDEFVKSGYCNHKKRPNFIVGFTECLNKTLNPN